MVIWIIVMICCILVIPTCATVTDNVHGLVWTKVIVGEMLTQSCPTGRLGL